MKQESNVSSQEPSIEDFRDQVLKVICENRDAIIRASNDRMTSVEVFETKNCFAAVINTYDDLFEIITVLKPNGDQNPQGGEPLVQNNPIDEDDFEEDPDPTCEACGYNHGNHMKGCPNDDSPFALLCRRGFD